MVLIENGSSNGKRVLVTLPSTNDRKGTVFRVETGSRFKSGGKRKRKRPYVDYKKYMDSKAWARRRSRYFRKHGKKCKVCDARYNVGLHHVPYERLGRERDEDLVALCWVHHEAFHVEIGGSKKNMVAETETFIAFKQFESEATLVIRSL
jgi:5-methylcytosine-specific restriction endonuclease McrA